MADISVLGVRKDIEMHQGNTLIINFELRDQADLPLDMTGYDLRLQVRQTYASTSTLINCTLANGKLAWISQTEGTFKLNLAPVDTTALRFSAESPDVLDAVFDLEVTSPNAALGTFKPWYGNFTILREVTR